MSPEEIVHKMMSNDLFSKWLGIEIISIKKGYCKLSSTISKEMTNGFNLAHGGICYSLADSCFAFTANSLGKISLTKSAEITYLKKVELNETIFAECEQHQKESIMFTVNILNQKKEEIAIFKGIAHFTNKDWI
jgi:acyl-CoA thioesterase